MLYTYIDFNIHTCTYIYVIFHILCYIWNTFRYRFDIVYVDVYGPRNRDTFHNIYWINHEDF